jgi:hypothetical protein
MEVNHSLLTLAGSGGQVLLPPSHQGWFYFIFLFLLLFICAYKAWFITKAGFNFSGFPHLFSFSVAIPSVFSPEGLLVWCRLQNRC